MVEYFLETGGKAELFRVLEFRLRAYRKQIVADFELMEKYFARATKGDS